MLPYKSLIHLDRKIQIALFQQLAHQIIHLIKQGVLIAGTKLPSSRWLADELGVHRKTIVSGYEELILQGWLETIPQKGTYVNNNLPQLQIQDIDTRKNTSINHQANFNFKKSVGYPLHREDSNVIFIDDGIPDVRLTPSKQIGQYFKEVSNNLFLNSKLGYESPLGSLQLRKSLAKHIQNTRGVQLDSDQILLTRGSQMGIYLSAKALVEKGDIVVVGESNYRSADLTFESFGGQLKRVKVDEQGIDTSEIEQLCLQYTIKAVYVTSHHHHPTTVTLSAQRRIHLLNLAQTYKFAIVEDDYDYDFHYKRAPILPLAAHDTNGNVIYIGSLCKTVAPGYRIGYLIASEDFVETCANNRRFIDRQGDTLLEHAFAKFIDSGDLTRHTNKVMKVYEERRTHFCNRLQSDLHSYLSFVYPTGGMAVWVTLKQGLTWRNVAIEALNHNVDLGEWQRYDYGNTGHNSIRIGFANYTINEMDDLIDRLISILKKIVLSN